MQILPSRNRRNLGVARPLLAAALAAVLIASQAGVSTTALAGKPSKIRQPAAAGGFYPADPDELSAMVDALLDQVPVRQIEGRPVAVVSPHAGYVYSGHIAAHSYALLRGRGFERVVVIAPSHVESFQGASVYDGDAYATPLGVIAVDGSFADRLAASSNRIKRSGSGHDFGRLERGEHALEVQLPFLQRVLGDFRLVPVVMGEQSYETCRALGVALAQLIDDDRTIVIASSDLSHFHDYDEAVRLDGKVTSAIAKWDYYSMSRNFSTRTWEACGGGPIVAAMMAAERLGAGKASILKYANSGDVSTGDRDRVVGYAAAVFVDNGKPPHLDDTVVFTLTDMEKRRLLEIARHSVETAVKTGKMSDDTKGSGILLDDRGAFVTLEKTGELRGCIGYVVATKPLNETVRDVAAFAAIRDRRFPPVSPEELDDLEYEVSVLSPLRRVTDLGQIQVGKHGLLAKLGEQEGLLLPQVASDRNWDRITFLQQTCRKAGLPADAWQNPDTDMFAFTAIVFDENSSH